MAIKAAISSPTMGICIGTCWTLIGFIRNEANVTVARPRKLKAWAIWSKYPSIVGAKNSPLRSQKAKHPTAAKSSTFTPKRTIDRIRYLELVRDQTSISTADCPCGESSVVMGMVCSPPRPVSIVSAIVNPAAQCRPPRSPS